MVNDISPSTGRFISVEGGEGVGKSLFCQGLLAALHDMGLNAVGSREPGGTGIAEKIRGIFAHVEEGEGEHMVPMTELLLLAAARSQHVSAKLRPGLASGTWFVCDRYIDSSRVYQGFVGGLQAAQVDAAIEMATGGLTPDLTFLLDCPLEVSAGRLKQREVDDQGVCRYDQAAGSMHQSIRDGYLKLAKVYPERMVVLDATLPPDQLVPEALTWIRKKLCAD